MVAVINQLAAQSTIPEVRFWCDRNYKNQSVDLMSQADIEVKVSAIFAGKLRRYHGSTIWQQLLDIPTILHNIFDVLLVIIGFFQSLIKLIVWRPKVIFLKGGFVCLPVGYAASLLRIPIVIHDSDAHAGLTNRLLAPMSKYIATGAPLKYYKYPHDKASYVGIPIRSNFKPASTEQKEHIKNMFGLKSDKPLVVVTGGGLGAKRINDALVAIAHDLSLHTSVVHITGAGQYDQVREKISDTDNYKVISFMSEKFDELVSAADIVISRAGASALAELSAVGASVILVPNGQLVGGHQLKNAQMYEEKGAVEIADETLFTSDPDILLKQIIGLLKDTPRRQSMSKKLQQFAKPDAALEVAKLIQKAYQE